MKKVELQVDGMSCGHCVHAVREALAGLPGVKVEHIRVGAATVEMDESRVGVGQLLEAVADAGYDAREARA